MAMVDMMSPLFNLLSVVAETGDSLTVEVQDEAGETVGTMPHLLTTAEVVAAKAEIDVDTTVPRRSKDT